MSPKHMRYNESVLGAARGAQRDALESLVARSHTPAELARLQQPGDSPARLLSAESPGADPVLEDARIGGEERLRLIKRYSS